MLTGKVYSSLAIVQQKMCSYLMRYKNVNFTVTIHIVLHVTGCNSYLFINSLFMLLTNS